MRLTRIFNEFFESEKSGGLVLICATLLSLGLANSSLRIGYLDFWNTNLGGLSIINWINDGLMTIFFLLIGLELKREIYHGELSNIKNATLPIMGALGGMIVPIIIFLSFNFGTTTQAGAGIPMATDIAFAIGILSLLGNRVPTSLKVFLTALAVIDDLGAILVIAVFYTSSLSFLNLVISVGIYTGLLLLNKLKVQNLLPYLLGGIAMWYFMLHSGVHATISGVLLAFAIPFGDGGKRTPSYRIQQILDKPVPFIILPLFAIANTCITIDNGWQNDLLQPNSLGIMAGLIFGKPLGILLFAFIGIRIGICSLPTKVKWKHLAGTGFLGGIGFTMSIFITMLAFSSQTLINNSKIAILIASFIAGVIGLVWLKLTLKNPIVKHTKNRYLKKQARKSNF